MLSPHDAINSLFVRFWKSRLKKHVPPNFLFLFGFWGYFNGIGVQSFGVRGVGLIGMHQGLINDETKMKREPKTLNQKLC